MRILGVLLSRTLDWALLGGFGRFAYKTLAGAFGFAMISEIWANGLTDWAFIFGVLTVGTIVALYGDDFF